MVGEIAHVVYAARLLSHLDNDISDSSYWVGALFPNIRTIGAESRHPTHPRSVTLGTLRGQNDFMTGMRVHAWIDETQAEHMKRNTVSEILPSHPLTSYALTLLEDELLYEAYNDWDVVRKALMTIRRDELQYVYEQSHVRAWHNILQAYFFKKPSAESQLSFSRAIGLSSASAEEVQKVMQTLRENSQAQKAIEGYLHELEHMLR